MKLIVGDKGNRMEHHLENTGINNSIWPIEQKLANFLEPVTPDPVFVDALRLKLEQAPAVLIETSHRKAGLLVMGIGMFTGALIFWMLRKRLK